jgi:hypothetical protein
MGYQISLTHVPNRETLRNVHRHKSFDSSDQMSVYRFSLVSLIFALCLAFAGVGERESINTREHEREICIRIRFASPRSEIRDPTPDRGGRDPHRELSCTRSFWRFVRINENAHFPQRCCDAHPMTAKPPNNECSMGQPINVSVIVLGR